MNAPKILKPASIQRGVASILVIVLLLSGLSVALIQTFIISSAKVSDDALLAQSTAALYIAEGGLEYATANIIAVGEDDPSAIAGFCANLPNLAPVNFGGGQFQFESAVPVAGLSCSPEGSGSPCFVRSRGSLGQAVRVVQAGVCLKRADGIAGYGGATSPVVMNVKRRGNLPGVVVSNLAWRILGSENPNNLAPNPAADASCTAPCDSIYNHQSSSGSSSVGASGVKVDIAAGSVSGQPTKVTHALSRDRDYIQVSMTMFGLSGGGTPQMQLPGYFGSTTRNNSANFVANGSVTNGRTSWCPDDFGTLVFGVSGRVPTIDPSLVASFQSVTFGTESGGPNIPMNNVARFPVTGTKSANGDIFSEVYVLHNAPFVGRVKSVATSATDPLLPVGIAQLELEFDAGTSARLPAPELIGSGGLRIRDAPTSGPRTIPAGTLAERRSDTIIRYHLNGSNPPAVGTPICGGMCALFRQDPTTAAPQASQFTINRVGGVTQWAGGFACLKNVNPNSVKAVVRFAPIIKSWQEVFSPDS